MARSGSFLHGIEEINGDYPLDVIPQSINKSLNVDDLVSSVSHLSKSF